MMRRLSTAGTKPRWRSNMFYNTRSKIPQGRTRVRWPVI
jgi:hypothetical protein